MQYGTTASFQATMARLNQRPIAKSGMRELDRAHARMREAP